VSQGAYAASEPRPEDLSFPLTRLVIALVWVGGVAVAVSLALQSLRSHMATGEAWLWGLVGAVIIVRPSAAYWSFVVA